jgi:hypothetical protein
VNTDSSSIQRTDSNAEGGEGIVTLPLGKVFGTFGAVVAFAGALDDDMNFFLSRHANGDWGEVNDLDRQANEYAVDHGLRVQSAYTLSSGEKIWIVTQGDRSVTTILLPGEY